MSSNLPEVEQALLAYKKQFDKRIGAAATEISQKLENLAKNEIKGERGVVGRKVSFVDGKTKRGGKIYDYGNDRAIIGQPPKSRTGNLRGSITGLTERKGFGKYDAIVGAYAVYAIAVEKGAPYNPPTWTKGEHFPFLQPAVDKAIKSKIVERTLQKHLGAK
jgi:hypothetical protein